MFNIRDLYTLHESNNVILHITDMWCMSWAPAQIFVGGGESKKAPIRIKNTPHGEIDPYNDISFNFPKGGGGGGQTLTLAPSRQVPMLYVCI